MFSRRSLLRFGLTAFGGLSLPGLCRLWAETTKHAKSDRAIPDRERTAIIVVFLHGGAIHLETWDPKPHAPAEYRGPFHTIETETPGLRFCELLPKQAAISNRFTILRSLVHSGFCHGIGLKQMFTSHEVREFKPRSEYPEFLSIINRLRSRRDRTLPNYVGATPIPYLGAAYLGPTYKPFSVSGDFNASNFQVPNIGVMDSAVRARLKRRVMLREQFDSLRHDLDQRGNLEAIDEFEQAAWNMLTSPDARVAFDLKREDPRMRDRYGRNTWGQQCLLARRLVESGVDLVTTTLAGPLCGRVQNWDDHAVNHHVFNAMQARAPYFDQAVSALIEDIYDRGLDRRVLVLVTGEFGRTPKIFYANDTASGAHQPGRDHWPSATSLMFAGGGLPVGQLVGATDPRGEQVIERRVSVHDLLATLYRHLGVDPSGIEFEDFSGRPIPILNGGAVIPELVA